MALKATVIIVIIVTIVIMVIMVIMVIIVTIVTIVIIFTYSIVCDYSRNGVIIALIVWML